jgi:hypothetical protein
MKTLALALTAAVALGACATGRAPAADAGATQAWRKVSQSNKVYAVYINEPGGERSGDLVSLRMVYVFMPGEVFTDDDQEVAFQDYHAITINCATYQVRLGRRTGHQKDGKVFLDEVRSDFTDISETSPIEDAANARCRNRYWVGNDRVPEGPNWMDEARRHVMASPAPERAGPLAR